jgi:sugar (pentulose or hexulose) kinase
MVPCVILHGEGGRTLRRSIQQNDARTGVEIIGLPLEAVATTAGSALGAAYAAGMGAGAFSDWNGVERFVEVREVIEPRHHERYEHPYRTYRGLYPALREVTT